MRRSAVGRLLGDLAGEAHDGRDFGRRVTGHAVRHVRAERVADDEDAPGVDGVLGFEIVDDRGQVLDVELRKMHRIGIPGEQRVRIVGGVGVAKKAPWSAASWVKPSHIAESALVPP